MTLPPSRKDATGPPPQDVSDLRYLVRHHGSALRRLDPGGLGGRFITPSPVRGTTSDLVGSDDDGDGADDIQFINTDTATAVTAGTVTLNLTYEPIEGSLHFRWNGLDQPPTEWTLDGQTVTFVNPHIHLGDVVTAAYAYVATDDDAPEPATATLRGTTSASGANGPALSGLPLPVGTVVGDLIVICAPGNVTVSDTRLSSIGNGMWIGWATNLADIAATAAGGFGSFWSVACITLATNASGWTAGVTSQSLGVADTATVAVPTVTGYGVAICSILDSHSTVSGYCATPVGYTLGIGSTPALVHSRVDFWTGASSSTSPAGPSTFNGGSGDAYLAVVGLIGPT